MLSVMPVFPVEQHIQSFTVLSWIQAYVTIVIMGIQALQIFMVIVLCISFGVDCSLDNAFFRKDYKYLPDTLNFYKIHMMPKTWEKAKMQCENEGASLYYPEHKAEALSVATYWNSTHNFRKWIFIAINDFLARGVYETDDGIPVSEVYNEWSPGEPTDIAATAVDCVVLSADSKMTVENCTKSYPFICKKPLSAMEWDVLCDIPDKTYQYNTAIGKCYKFHPEPLTWSDAYGVCTAEQSYLAIINNQAEAGEILKVMQSAKSNLGYRNPSTFSTLLGFHKKTNNQWRTVRGTTLEESGYVKWATGQLAIGNATCGAMSPKGELLVIPCDNKSSFICEHDIDLLADSINDRFSSINEIKNNNCEC